MGGILPTGGLLNNLTGNIIDYNDEKLSRDRSKSLAENTREQMVAEKENREANAKMADAKAKTTVWSGIWASIQKMLEQFFR